MTSVTRLFTLAATIAVTVLAAGCASSSSAGSSVPPASRAAPAPASHAAASEPATTGRRRGIRVRGAGVGRGFRDQPRRSRAVRCRRVLRGEPGRDRDDRARGGLPGRLPAVRRRHDSAMGHDLADADRQRGRGHRHREDRRLRPQLVRRPRVRLSAPVGGAAHRRESIGAVGHAASRSRRRTSSKRSDVVPQAPIVHSVTKSPALTQNCPWPGSVRPA
jgi:hypothetical protein